MNTATFGFFAGIALIIMAYSIGPDIGKYIHSKITTDVCIKEVK